jgi:hypothetical protein
MKYKNISGRDLWVVGYGKVKADGILNAKKGFHNVNFQVVNEPIVEKAEKKEEIKKNKQ